MSLDPNAIDGDEEIAATFRRLRRDGYSRPEAMQALLDALNVSLAEAKHLLLTHDTWAEVQAAAASPAADAASASTDDESNQSTPPPAPG